MIAGIDFDVRAIHIALVHDDGFSGTYHRVDIDGRGTSLEAARMARMAFPRRSWWEDRGVWLVGIEEPFSRHATAIVALNRILGAILALVPAELPIVATPQTEWLKKFTGLEKLPQSSFDRKALALERGRQFGFHCDTPDGYDAFGIACAVRAMNDDAVADAEYARRNRNPEVTV